MATPGNANTAAPGTTTDGNTTQTQIAEPNVENNDIAKQNNNEYKLMDQDEDIDDGEEGYDMKNEDDDEKKIDINVANAKPFGGYKVAPKINGVFKKSEIIMEAINKMERDINLGKFERKENEKLIDDHFNKLFNKLNSKKLELIKSLNGYYNNNKQESVLRINELKLEYNKELENEKDINYNEIEQELQLQQNQQQEQNIFKRQLTKLKSKKNVSDKNNNKPKIKTHDKLRIFFPTKSLYKIIDEEIRIGSDWWNSLKIDHNEFNFHDSKIWRLKSGGWFNAFGSNQVGYTQKKRWNIKILPNKNCDLSQPADLVIGIVKHEIIDKLFNKNKGKGKKANGFWTKNYQGFGFYGWNGKIFHKQKRGIVYGNAFNVNNIISVELDMGLKLEDGNGNDNKKKKSKAKTNKVKNVKKGIMIASGATISFYVDNKNIGVAFYDIDITKEYVLAVALNSGNYILQLMD